MGGSGLRLADGLYVVELYDGSTREAWYISRKNIWVTPDGAEAINNIKKIVKPCPPR
jgi:hypothetical protein